MLKKFGVAACLSVSLCAQGWVDRSVANGPVPRFGHAMCYDPIRNYTLMAGGASINGTFQWQVDAWSWDGTSWTTIGSPLQTTGSGFSSSAINSCAMAFHATAGHVLLVSRSDMNSPGPIASWLWNGTTWSSTPGTSLMSYPHYPLAAAYDPIHQHVVCFSAVDPSKVAVWDGATWQVVTALVQPSIGSNAEIAMAWDAAVGRIVLLAQASFVGNLPRIHEWTGLSWNLRLPTSFPPRVGAATADIAHQCIVMVDSDWSGIPGASLPNHTWLASNGQFTRLTTPVEPTLRAASAFAYDSARNVSVMFGGSNGYPMGDTWEFDLGPLASFTSYGTGCNGSRGVPNIAAQGASLPRIGNTFTAHVTNLPWTGPALLLLGLSNTTYGSTPLPIDLGFLGAPTCSLRTSIDDIQPIANILGAATWSWTVPPIPGASFYAQVLPIDPGVNALALTASNACHGVIGL